MGSKEELKLCRSRRPGQAWGINVVAIHGLETTSEKTWTFDSRNSENEINWLEDDSMLAKALEEADIWTYDWPADTFQDNPVQGALQDRAKSFLDHLYTQLSKDKPSPVELDQIIFIASCFGGLLLADAIYRASTSSREHGEAVLKATVGIVFLGTPFRGSDAFNFARWAARLYKPAVGDSPPTLLQRLYKNDELLENLRWNFIDTARRTPIPVVCFYETKPTNLLKKVLPGKMADFLSRYLSGTLITLVPKSSAVLDIADNFPMHVPHSVLNKFRGPECPNFTQVREKLIRLKDGIPRLMDDREKSSKKAYNTLPSRNPDFIAREHFRDKFLKKIVESVDPSKRLDTCPRTCIYGLDGVGKTELALEAAWRLHDAKKPDNLCSIFWVSASTETSFEKGYRLIGKTLQLDPERKTFTQVVEIVNDRLRTRPGPWLLIVDDVKEWMDDQILPQGPNGSILATAASSSMASRLKMQFYYLEHLSLEEAIDLLKLPFSNETFINAENVSEANTLVSDHLLYHPLAIKLASKYMKVQGASITGYLALFKGQSLNNQGLYPIDRDTQRAVAEAWLLSFEKIKNGNKAALPILKRIAFCEEKNIHVSHLQIDIDDRVLNTLVEYSFVVKNIIAKRIDVHQLVQMAMIDWFQSQGTFDKEARLEVETQLEKLPFPTSASKEQWEESLPHAERALEKAEEAFRHPDRDLDLPNIFSYGESGWRLLYMVGQANFMLKRYEKAKKFHLRALDLERAARTNRSREKLAGAEDSEQGDTDDFSMNDLSALMQRESRACRHLIQGPHSEGSKELLEVWEKAKSHLGEAHPLTINTLETLAYALKHQDNIDDAVTRFEEVLRLKRESLPRDSRSILKSIENLAAVYQQQGIYDKAQILLQEAVQLCAKVHGSEHEHDPTVAYREQLRLLAELQELERIRAKLHGGM